MVALVTGLRLLKLVLGTAASAVRNGWRHRVLGLSAEAGFWQLLSLPSALLGVLGTIGFFQNVIGKATVNTLENRILQAAAHFVTPSSVNTLVKPTVEAVLHGGRAEIVSTGFVLSLWSGSSALATFINTISIAYNQREGRSAVRARLLALGVYVVSMAAGIVILPLLIIGPNTIDKIPAVAHNRTLADLINLSYLPIVGGISVIALTSLYRVAPPRPHRWIAGIPGALAAAGLWFAGSVGLRAYIGFSFRRTAAYGALGAPVAVLLFFYVTALAVLLGAELNAEIARRRAVHLGREGERRVEAVN
jgi:membrane protein